MNSIVDAAPVHTRRLVGQDPFDRAAVFSFLERRAIPGVESVEHECYRRVFRIDGETGWFDVVAAAAPATLDVHVRHASSAIADAVTQRVRALFDIDADAAAIALAFEADADLGAHARRHRGLRVPGCWDGFEIAVRAILGQQVSVAAARTLAARLVQRYGERITDVDDPLTMQFPDADTLADADVEAIGLPRTRATTIRTLARAVVDGEIDFGTTQPLASFIERCTALRGIGAWTAHYIAMRALRQRDAFPAGDLILRRAARPGTVLSERALEAVSDAWRPWRAYAVPLLWRSQDPA